MQEENCDQEINEASIVDPVLTFTMSSISSVTFSAGAAVRTRLVNTAGMSVAKMNSFAALINISAYTTITIETVFA